VSADLVLSKHILTCQIFYNKDEKQRKVFFSLSTE
jgi:hypothetical protein